MLLRSVSILATVVLMAAAAALVFRGAILGTGKHISAAAVYPEYAEYARKTARLLPFVL
jgi:hypothetical protein